MRWPRGLQQPNCSTRSDMSSPPSWWLFGGTAYASLTAQPLQCACVIERMLDPSTTALEAAASAPAQAAEEAVIPRMRLAPVQHVSEREHGVSLCSRERSERSVADRLRADADAAKVTADSVEVEALEVERQLEEGLILPDGTPAPVKRKRSGPGRPPNSEKLPASGGIADGADGGEGDTLKKVGKAKKPRLSGGEEENGGVPAGRKEKEVKTKKAAKKGGAAATPSFFEVYAAVEVSLRLGDSFANWYEAVLLEQGKGSKWKVALRRMRSARPKIGGPGAHMHARP